MCEELLPYFYSTRFFVRLDFSGFTFHDLDITTSWLATIDSANRQTLRGTKMLFMGHDYISYWKKRAQEDWNWDFEMTPWKTEDESDWGRLTYYKVRFMD